MEQAKGRGCTSFLFGVSDDFNRLKSHNINFKVTQSIRLFFIIASFAIWGTLLYVWAKAIFAQLQFYILTAWLFAIITVACSAGREVVEVKLVEKLKTEKLAKNEIMPEQLDEVQLPYEEKSTTWKIALLAYSLATPLVLASPIMYMLFSESMFKGEVCKFYELASSVNDQQACLKDYNDETKSMYMEEAGFRYQAFLMGLFAPACFFLIEFFMNQLLMSWKQLVHQYIFTSLYAMATAIWQISTGDAVIFPGTLDWNSKDDLFNECILWFIYFACVQTLCFSLVLLLHYAKATLCCKKSVQIITYDENVASQLGSLKRD